MNKSPDITGVDLLSRRDASVFSFKHVQTKIPEGVEMLPSLLVTFRRLHPFLYLTSGLHSHRPLPLFISLKHNGEKFFQPVLLNGLNVKSSIENTIGQGGKKKGRHGRVTATFRIVSRQTQFPQPFRRHVQLFS